MNTVWKPILRPLRIGHTNIGLQKLRILARLTGFKIQEIRYTRISKGSIFLFPFFNPFIFISSYLRYFRNISKHKEIPKSYKIDVYKEQLKININPKHLLNKHIFVIFEKEKELKDGDFRIESNVKPFGKIM